MPDLDTKLTAQERIIALWKSGHTVTFYTAEDGSYELTVSRGKRTDVFHDQCMLNVLESLTEAESDAT